MVTLHAYILRELLKTLGLSLAALTALFTMGGGLYNVIRYQGVSAADVVGFLPLLIPIVVTLTLPIAALFSVTMVYGRLAADNELVACRAAGINIHRLFLSVVLLSVFVALVMLVMGNFVIPRFIYQISDAARMNLRDFVANHLQREGFIHHRHKKTGAEYTLTAGQARIASDAALRAKGFETGPGLNYLVLTSPTFLHLDPDGKLVRFTIARYGVCCFDTRRSPVEVTLEVAEARDFQLGRHTAFIGQQTIGPVLVPGETPLQLSWARLDDLLRWRQAPWEAPRARDLLRDFQATLTIQRFYGYCAQRLETGVLVLYDERGRSYRVSAAEVQASAKGLTLTEARVEMQAPNQKLPVRYEAERVELRAAPLPSGECAVELRLLRTATRDVLEYDPRAGRYGEPRRKPTLSLDGAQIPAEIRQEVLSHAPAALLNPNTPLDGAEAGLLHDRRLSLWNAVARLKRQIDATIHFRLGYVCSALVTIIMGAALGVIFRGARALAAFALAMIPLFGVMILLVLGRQLSEDARTTQIGPLVTWGGLGLVLLADALLLRVGVRR